MFERETILLYAEPCDCGDRIRHNNGGNYHRIVRLHTFVSDEQWVVVLERTSTRETFAGDRCEGLLLNSVTRQDPTGAFELWPEEHLDQDEKDKALAWFHSGEAEVLARN